MTQVATARGTSIVDFTDDDLPQRYFALDHLGRPRFVYNDRDTFREPDHLGTFYAYCDSDCSDAANWLEVRLGQDNGNEWNYRYEKFSYPALTFSATGQPRVVAEGYSMQDESALYYVACDAECGNRDSWQSAPLYPRGSGVKVSYDIALNAAGQPRIAYYDGAQLQGKGDRLAYLWCNNACTDAAAWARHELGLPSGEGQGPDLELDSDGRPHIAYALYNAGGVGYGWCASNCESAAGEWQHQMVETGRDLAAVWPVAYPPHCDGGLWNGLTPTLALDGEGNATIGYDATYHARCWYNVVTREWETFSQFNLVWRAARVVFVPQE